MHITIALEEPPEQCNQKDRAENEYRDQKTIRQQALPLTLFRLPIASRSLVLLHLNWP
jgi:hypothetical protein